MLLAEELVLEEWHDVISPDALDPVLIECGWRWGSNNGRRGYEVAVADLELLAGEIGGGLVQSIDPIREFEHRRLIGLEPSPQDSF